MKQKQEDAVKKREKQLAKKNAEARLIEKRKEERKRKEQLKVTYKIKQPMASVILMTHWPLSYIEVSIKPSQFFNRLILITYLQLISCVFSL